MNVSDYVYPISHPSKLRQGEVIVRVRRAGEVCEECWRVVRWIPPVKARPGESSGAGFLRCASLDDNHLQSFGPASLVRSDFRKGPSHPEKTVVRVQQKLDAKPAKRYWWEDND